jgi:uncharacterized protein
MAVKDVNLSKSDARKLAVSSQFLFRDNPPVSGPDGTFAALCQMGYVQLDTISVIQRAHHHSIWNRNRAYSASHLETLQGPGRRIFEYWSHAAAYLPVKDYRFCLPRMRRIKTNGFEWFKKDKKMVRLVLDRIKSEGPLMAKDFESPDHKAGPWWGWKPAKIALEHLFMEGTILVSKRKGFQKVYDLTERVIPGDIDTRMPTALQTAHFLVDNSLRSLGIVSLKDIVYGRKDRTEMVSTVLNRRLKQKKLVPLRIDGVNEPYYASPELLEALDSPLPPVIRFLSPFDNFVIRRQRLTDLFDFSYQLECYVPATKRKRGYFSLPILYSDRIIGTMDAKADRKSGILVIKSMILDTVPEDEDNFLEHFRRELNQFMGFNECNSIEMERIHPIKLKNRF